MESKDVARVVMLWPADLKQQIQKEVGKRGLTAYVLDAVREKRGIEETRKEQVQVIETPVQKEPEPINANFWVSCKVCGTELENGSCWVCE